MSNVTKLYKGWQTVVPLDVRKKLNIGPDDVLEWKVTEDGKAVITFRKKKNIQDIVGIVHSKERTDAVKLKKKAQKGDDKF